MLSGSIAAGYGSECHCNSIFGYNSL